MSSIGLVGLAVMGQNLALNVAEKGFPISVYNRSGDKTDACVARAQKEGARGGRGGRGGGRGRNCLGWAGIARGRRLTPSPLPPFSPLPSPGLTNLKGFHDLGEFVASLEKPR